MCRLTEDLARTGDAQNGRPQRAPARAKVEAPGPIRSPAWAVPRGMSPNPLTLAAFVVALLLAPFARAAETQVEKAYFAVG